MKKYVKCAELTRLSVQAQSKLKDDIPTDQNSVEQAGDSTKVEKKNEILVMIFS